MIPPITTELMSQKMIGSMTASKQAEDSVDENPLEVRGHVLDVLPHAERQRVARHC